MTSSPRHTPDDRQIERFDDLIKQGLHEGTFGTVLDGFDYQTLERLGNALSAELDRTGSEYQKNKPGKLTDAMHAAITLATAFTARPGVAMTERRNAANLHYKKLVGLWIEVSEASSRKADENRKNRAEKRSVDFNQYKRVQTLISRAFGETEFLGRIVVGDQMQGPDDEWGIITVDKNARDADIIKFIEENLSAARQTWKYIEQENGLRSKNETYRKAGFTLHLRSTPPYKESGISRTDYLARADELGEILIEEEDFADIMSGLDESVREYYLPTIFLSENNGYDDVKQEGHTSRANIFINTADSLIANRAYIYSCLPQLREYVQRVIEEENAYKESRGQEQR